MDWPSLISDLQTRGLSLTQIGKLCEAGQATISDLKNKPGREPAFQLGQSILRLSRANDKALARLKAGIEPATEKAA